MITLAQVFLFTLATLAMIGVIFKYRDKKIGARFFLLWLFLWAGAAVVILFPESTTAAASLLHIGRGADVVLYLGVILILYLLFTVFVRMERMDREITKIVRNLALRDLKESPGEHSFDSPKKQGKS
ncbi:MAG: DUF2304 domain-containing protein [Deltaproteobacteria bacterium]|nr:DUF2304 domain-containing protein [Deltaproteobacteria bacterium]MBI4374012.1 DUF2304 domain-containing protein [Deltaproteobacteria bacterium]